MKIVNETATLREFETWAGATSTKDTILEHGLSEEFDALMEDLYPEGLTDTQLNDILWHDSKWILSELGIKED